MAGTVTMSSCIGSFNLFKSVLNWNKSLGNKFVNELVFILISPAYAVCGVIDLFVLNTVEFWSGKNPIGKVGNIENVWGQDGKMYAVKTLKNGYEVKKPDGEVVMFVHNDKDNSWTMQVDGKTTELFRFNEDGTVSATMTNGEKMNVELSEAGIYSVRMAENGGSFFAAR